MTDTKALNALADVICRAQANGRRTPMGIAMAIESARMLMSPETAAELARLRARIAELEAAPIWLRTDELTPGVALIAKDMTRFTVDSVKPCTVDFRFQGRQADGTYTSESGMEVTGHDDTGEAVHFTAAQSYRWQHDVAAELNALRGRVAELEAERHTANSALAEVTVALRAAESAQGPETYPPAMPWAKWLDDEDRADFLDELAAAAIIHASGARALAEVEDTCARWRLIADATKAHLTAPGPACTCPEPVLDCTGVSCGCPVCHRAVIPAAEPVPFVLTEQAEAELLPAVVTTYADQAGARLRRLGHPLDRGVRS